MKNQGLKITMGLAVIAVGYAIYDYQADQFQEKRKTEQAKLLRFDKDQISDVEISRGPDQIKLHRSQDGWQITAPIKETADQNSTIDFVEAATLEKSTAVVKEGAEVDWKVFGLDHPKATIKFQNNAGENISFEVSEKHNFAGECYLRQTGVNKVFTASSNWTLKADKKVFDFRDRRLLKKASMGISKFGILKDGKELLGFERNGEFWVSPTNKDWRLDQTKVNDLAFNLNNISVLDFTLETEISKKDLALYGLLKPQLSIDAEFKDQGHWHADFGENDKKQVFVLTSEPKRVVKVSPGDLAKFNNLSLESLRDKREAFQFDKDKVRKVHIVVGDKSADFEKKGDDWKAVGGALAVQKIPALFMQLKNSEIADFASHPSAPFRTKIDLQDDSGASIWNLELGDAYTLNGKPILAAKTSSYPQHFGIEMNLIPLLNDFVGIKATALPSKDNKEENP